MGRRRGHYALWSQAQHRGLGTYALRGWLERLQVIRCMCVGTQLSLSELSRLPASHLSHAIRG